MDEPEHIEWLYRTRNRLTGRLGQLAGARVYSPQVITTHVDGEHFTVFVNGKVKYRGILVDPEADQ